MSNEFNAKEKELIKLKQELSEQANIAFKEMDGQGNFTDEEQLVEQYLKEGKESEKFLEAAFFNSDSVVNDQYSPRAGDIVITSFSDKGKVPDIVNGSSSKVYGHAGIFINEKDILHIRGVGRHPSLVSWSEWKNSDDYSYKNTWVIRHQDLTYATKAAQWAEKTYGPNGRYANAEYNVFSTSDVFKYTYCSKIVWQAYYYGNMDGNDKPNPNVIKKYSGWCLPYKLHSYFVTPKDVSVVFAKKVSQ